VVDRAAKKGRFADLLPRNEAVVCVFILLLWLFLCRLLNHAVFLVLVVWNDTAESLARRHKWYIFRFRVRVFSDQGTFPWSGSGSSNFIIAIRVISDYRSFIGTEHCGL
jgi:hypothetical protein